MRERRHFRTTPQRVHLDDRPEFPLPPISTTAGSPSGKAELCKSSIAGSIPAPASL